MIPTPESLIGQFFLTFDSDGRLQFQGKIVACPESGYFMCQYFSALTGFETDRKIRQIPDMLEWEFYDTVDEWRSAYRSYFRRDWR